MRLIIDIPEEDYKIIKDMTVIAEPNDFRILVKNGTPIPDNTTNGKEVLIKYCLEHSGEEIYDLLKRVSDASKSWTDSRGFIIEWLEKGCKE